VIYRLICVFYVAPDIILTACISQTFDVYPPFVLEKGSLFSHSETTRLLPGYSQRYLNVSERLEISLAIAFPTKDLGGLQSGATDGTRWPNRLDDKPTKEPKAPLYFCDYFCNYCAFFEGFPSGFSEST